MDGWMERWMDG
jgi:hypothetical protein